MSGRRRLDWLGLTPEPERELPAAVAALRASLPRPPTGAEGGSGAGAGDRARARARARAATGAGAAAATVRRPTGTAGTGTDPAADVVTGTTATGTTAADTALAATVVTGTGDTGAGPAATTVTGTPATSTTPTHTDPAASAETGTTATNTGPTATADTSTPATTPTGADPAATGATAGAGSVAVEGLAVLVAAERRRVERLVLRGGRHDWLRYLSEVTGLVTAVAAGTRPGDRTAALLAAEVVLDHHRMLIGLPGPGYGRTAGDRTALEEAVRALSTPTRTGDPR
ncbi:hypothetical protein [Streptomyces sp. NPDC086023]|uniref:hypothetical protein n=1 Tax=Streptomyces sp. NPDC086023 TaxID=3365746 RepID=UPI0037CFE63C